jgi:Protein of unknown function (DUF3987)
VRFGDLTLEALARSLYGAEGAGVLDLDELSVLLRGFGEYKRAGGGDRGRFLALWSGAPWSFSRVGGGDKRNKVKFRISRPTLVICGGLQPALHELLGGEEDGLRPRWLPHLAAAPETAGELGQNQRPNDWQLLLGAHLLPKRHSLRTWRLDGAGLEAFQEHRKRYKAAARGLESASTSAALVKADVHLARVALVLAEASAPARGGNVGADVVHRAARIVEFTLDCWRALPEQGGLALSRVDWHLDRSIDRLVAWLEEHGGQASRRELQRAHVAGVRTSSDLDALLKRYEQRFPASVVNERQEGGRGLPTVVVKAPRRSPVPKMSPIWRHQERNAEKAHSRAESAAVASGDTLNGDTLNGDTISAPVKGTGTAGPGCFVHLGNPVAGCRYCESKKGGAS